MMTSDMIHESEESIFIYIVLEKELSDVMLIYIYIYVHIFID